MIELHTIHTEIERGEVVFNSPVSYTIKSKDDGSTIDILNIQKGPVKERGVNGLFIEDLLLIAIDQLEHFQNSESECIENSKTLGHLRSALYSTRARQYEILLKGTQSLNIK